MTSKKMVAYQFPELPIQDIIANTLDMGGIIEEKQLLNPTSGVIWPLYEALAEYVCIISRDELQQPAFDVLRKLEYPEMHEESVGCIASWHTIRQLMLAAGITDFSFHDITKPTSARTIRFLSGLINYAKFRKDREYAVAELQDETLPETKQLLEEEVEQIKHEIASIEAERASQGSAVQALEEENAELWKELSTLNKKQSVYQGEIRTLKQELNSLTDAISGQKFMLQQANNEGSDLRGQIVESPEKLERALEEKKATLEATEAAVEEARKSLQRQKQKHESYTKTEKKVQKLLGLYEEAQRLLTQQKTAMKEVKALKAKIKADEEEDQHISSAIAGLVSKGQQYQDLIDNAEQIRQERIREQEKALGELKAQYCDNIKRQQAVKADISAARAQVLHLNNQKVDLLKKKDEVIQSCEEEISAVQHQVLDYYRSLLSCARPIPQQLPI